MRKSITQQAIALASKMTQKKIYSSGFKRKGVHLYRKSGELFHAIHFQASQWGSFDEGKFTVNFIVASPILYTVWVGRTFPANPASAPFPIQMRIGGLMPQRCDYWWNVSSESDLGKLATDVADEIEYYAENFFSFYENNSGLLERLRQGVCPGCTRGQSYIVHAVIANELGYKEEAAEVCAKAIAESNIAAFSEKVFNLASKLGLSLP